MLSNA
ncbi:hypothetical protein RDI58_009857 [Solanum bulbocastanum]